MDSNKPPMAAIAMPPPPPARKSSRFMPRTDLEPGLEEPHLEPKQPVLEEPDLLGS